MQLKPDLTTSRVLPAEPERSYTPDQPLGELGFAEQFTIWCLRVQWRISVEGAERSVLLQRAFNALDMPEGAAMVADLALGLSRTVQRPLSIPCPHWRVLTSDEVRILNFISALQQHNTSPRTALDPSWMAAPCGASPIWAPAQRFALALSSAGLMLGAALYSSSPFPEAMPRLLH
jgi:hypothetical protein